MSNEVYANGNEIACKSGDGKVIAAFPDVCLSPPSPPAGPVPVPYPDTSFSKDMQNGSKTVQIDGKEIMLKDKSFYKTSPLGDEAATNTLGQSVITHVITGKTYFIAWSMDVLIEGENVDRHVDLTTSNHASYPGSTPPLTNMEAAALESIKEGKCPCCGEEAHAKGTPMNMEEWYIRNVERKTNHKTPEEQSMKLSALMALLEEARVKKGCTCTGTRLLPEPPCDVFYERPRTKSTNKKQITAIRNKWDNCRQDIQEELGVPSMKSIRKSLRIKLGRRPRPIEVQDELQINHLTPKSAGGCPTGKGNLQPMYYLCSVCRRIDKQFSKFQ